MATLDNHLPFHPSVRSMTLQPELRFATHRNHYLFSDYYLTHRVAERQEWMELDARPRMTAFIWLLPRRWPATCGP